MKEENLLQDKNPNAIEVRNLTITYKGLKAYSIKKSLFKLKKTEMQEYTAVNDVSFDVKKGEILGILGKNGCGKSTMLRAIGGVFKPNSGTIDLKGNTVSLLAIGVGFQKQVTGRENILLSGMLLGFSEEEIRAKMHDIIAFSELGAFIDKPVKTYSSGMHSKLAFSIAVNLETDILLIDEVLAVGDQRFKQKSQRKMKEIISQKDRTVVIVSHNIKSLRNLCDRVMWMHDGEIVKIGAPSEVCPEYRQFMRKRRQAITDELMEELHQEMKEREARLQAAKAQQS
ncbi:MAG: ABC transporter ATP-binding protein [Lachnospiraceae bacterium]|nr:ABC transporter ATP-binding protein [Lachnospiraceae bacterium]